VKLHASSPSGVNTITGYGEGYVMVNGARRSSSVVVLPDRTEDWSVTRFDDLRAEDFAFLRDLQAEIVLLGTGARQRFPHPRLTAALASAGIGLEVIRFNFPYREKGRKIPDPMPDDLKRTPEGDKAFEDAEPMEGEAPTG